MSDTPDLVQAENRRLISTAIDETTEALSQLVERLLTETSSPPPEKERKNVLRSMRRRVTRLFEPTAEAEELVDKRAFPLYMSSMLHELLLELQRFVSNPSRPLVSVDGSEVYMTLVLEGINGLTHSIGMLLESSKLDASVIPGVVNSGFANIFVIVKFLGTGFNLFPSQAEGESGEQCSDDDDGMLRAVWGTDLSKLLAQEKNFEILCSMVSEVATPGNVTVDPKEYPDMCPLEWAFIVEGPVGLPNRRKLYPLEQFRAWANPVGERSSSTSSQLGVIQSIHLYREIKAPLHHEFALVRLGNECIPSSWIRVERAARYKMRKIETDSLGPLFGGVTLRENISFATEKTKLIYSEANELAVVRRTPKASELDPFHLTELAGLMNSIFVASSKYRLLTYNCRWFARQLTLITAQRFDSLVSGLSTTTWKGDSVTYEQLTVAFADDPFGGRPLRDEQSAWIHSMNKYEAAAHLMENGQWEEALTRFRGTLPLIKARTTQDGGLPGSRLLGSVLVRESLCLLHLGRRDEALRSLDEALEIFENSMHPPRRQGARDALVQASLLAGQFAVLGLNKQARRLQLAALNGWPGSPEELSRVEPPPHVNRIQMVIAFVHALGNAARFAKKDGDLVEALSLSEAAVRQLAALHRADAELYRTDLAWHLNLFSDVLQDAGRVGEAFLVSSLCLRLMRQEERRKYIQSVFAYVLWTHVHVCRVMGDAFYCGDGEECEAESVRITRTLYAEKPDLYRFNLGVLLLQRVGRLANTVRWMRTGHTSSSLSPATMSSLLPLMMEITTTMPEALDLWRTIAASHPPAIRHYIDLLELSTDFQLTPPSPELGSVKVAAKRSGALSQSVSLNFFCGHEGWTPFSAIEKARSGSKAVKRRTSGA